MNTYFSVIVPVYNAEKLLLRCCDSILGQTYPNFELLLIDDGSTDSSDKICDEYADKDQRVRVFRKQNAGVSSARNLGISMARGEYSIHVDADDYIEKNMLKDLHAKIMESDADMIVMDYYRDEKEKIEYVSQLVFQDGKESLVSILNGSMMGAMWNKAIRHRLYSKYNLAFNEKVHYCEDVLLLSELLMHPTKIEYLPKAYYHYVYNPHSITSSTPSRKLVQSRILFLDKISSTLQKHSLPLSVLQRHQSGVKLSIIESALYSKKEYDSVYPDIDIHNKLFLSRKNRYKLFLASYHKVSWILLKDIVKIKNIIKTWFLR